MLHLHPSIWKATRTREIVHLTRNFQPTTLCAPKMTYKMKPFEYDKEIKNLSIAVGSLQERLARANKMYFEPASGQRPAWKRFEPSLDALLESISDFRSAVKAIRGPSTREPAIETKRRKSAGDGWVPKKTHKSSAHAVNRFFLCFSCKENGKQSSPYFKSSGEVLTHWVQQHKSTGAGDEFLFYVANRMQCYHCNFSGIYSSQISHYRQEHSPHDLPFVLVSHENPLECAVCHGIENIDFDGMVDHFRADHPYLLHTYLVDPTYWSGEALLALRAIDAGQTHSQNGPRTESDVAYLICHCDRSQKIAPDAFFAHCKQHVIDAKCLFCVRRLTTIDDLVKHVRDKHGMKSQESATVAEEKRRILANFRRLRFVFGNGLVAMAQNMTGTNYDASDQFKAFVNEWMDEPPVMDTAE